MTGISRRAVIKGFAAAGVATYVNAGAMPRAVGAPAGIDVPFSSFTAIAPSSDDVLGVPPGYDWHTLIKWGDEFGEGLRFGYNCDYTSYFPLKGTNEGILWVNHEYVIPYYVTDWRSSQDSLWDPRVEPYASLMALEKDSVGGSLVHVRRMNGQFQVVPGSSYNRRITAAGPLIAYDGPVAGSGLVPDEGALGTLANCSGGHTPWGTVLSAEENYQSYGLDRLMPFNLGWDNNGDPDYYAGEVQPQAGSNGLNAYGAPAVEVPNYGYVVEVDPYTGAAVRHTALGRIHHENVTMRIHSDGRVVAYTGDDAPAADGMLFKFVSSGRYHRGMSRTEAMGLLSAGQLYVAQFREGVNNPSVNSGTGRWHPLEMTAEAMAFTTKWVRDNIFPLVGGSAAGAAQFHVPRAEDVEILPNRPQDIVMALTSATPPGGGTAYGALRFMHEASLDPDNRDFTWTDLIEGGPGSGVANPDNIGFSPDDGGLWLTSDISTSAINPNTSAFAFHGNNALYYVPLEGPNANLAFRFANAPARAELTGPTFVGSDTLFLSVQHPGEPRNNELDRAIHTDNYPSWWPEGNRTTGTNPSKPKSAVVAIRKV